jgi:hypothetical protein
MNRAAVVHKEVALRIARYAQAKLIACAVHVAPLERPGRNTDKPGRARKVGFGQVHKALLTAALGASRLAFKAKTGGHASLCPISASDRYCGAANHGCSRLSGGYFRVVRKFSQPTRAGAGRDPSWPRTDDQTATDQLDRGEFVAERQSGHTRRESGPAPARRGSHSAPKIAIPQPLNHLHKIRALNALNRLLLCNRVGRLPNSRGLDNPAAAT